MKKLLSVLFMAAAAMAQAEDIIPAGAVNIATSSGKKTSTFVNLHSTASNRNSLFDGTRNRWLGVVKNISLGACPEETVTFEEARPIINAYRVQRASGNSDYKQSRQATKWEFYGSSDKGASWTLLHSQTNTVVWYEGGKSGSNYVIDHFDCAFENTIPYSTYKFRVTASGGATDYAAVDDVELYCLERSDTLTIKHNGYEVGAPTPAYGAVSGLKNGDEVMLSMAETRIVDPATSRRYELTGFTIKYSDGSVVHEGQKSELPYTYTHGKRAATVVWNWSDPLSEFAESRRNDLTVPENSANNEISDAKMDGSAMTYINTSGRAAFGPQFLFDDNTSQDEKSRWDPKTTPPYYAQYVFRQNGEEVRKLVTGLGLRSTTRTDRRLLGFDFMASNDGSVWTKLLSIPGPATIVTNVWDFANATPYSRYRFVVTDADSTLEMHNLEFYNYRGNDVLEIIGSPAYGQPDPDYGVIADLTQGATLTLTAPTTEVVVSEDEKSVCTGYILSVDGEEPVAGTGTTYSYVHSGKGSALTWKFSSSYRHRVGVKGAGSVDCPADSFVAAGTSLTITATPESDDEPFLEWQGDVPEGQASNPVLTFTVDKPRSLTAVFAAPVYVSATGNDENDGSSWAQAVATVARGWELCGGAGKLYLGEGEFAVAPGVLNVTHSLRIEGQGPEKTALLSTDSEANVSLLTVGHERAVVTGVRVKGAALASGNGAGIQLAAGVVTNCCIDGCSTPGYAGGIWMEGTSTLVDSVITNCSASTSAGGAYVVSGTFLRNLVVGCDSKDCGGVYFRSAMTVADSVFRSNSSSGNGAAVGCDNYAVLFTNCVFEANSASISGVIDNCPYLVAFDDCLFTNNVASSRCSVGMHFAGTIRRSRLACNRGSGDYGGLLHLDKGGALSIGAKFENSLVIGNSGGQGVIRVNANATILNCTIVGNSFASVTNGAIRADGGQVRNSIIADNSRKDGVVSNWTGSAATRAVYSCIPGHDPAELGTGSISAEPRFAGAARGNFALKSSSPCVNAGSNSYVKDGDLDLVGNPRIHVFGKAKYDIVDMGCYESPYSRRTGLRIIVR